MKIICYCSNIDEETIINSIKNGANTLGKIRKETKACTIGDCKNKSPKKICCSKDILDLINKYF